MGKGYELASLQEDTQMANEHMVRCSPSLGEELQAVRYHCRPTRKVIKQTGLTSRVGEDVAKLESLCIITAENEKWCSHFGKQSGISSKG